MPIQALKSKKMQIGACMGCQGYGKDTHGLISIHLDMSKMGWFDYLHASQRDHRKTWTLYKPHLKEKKKKEK